MQAQKGLVRLLLAREDVNPNRLDEFGRTPISWAAGYGCETMVKLLLARKSVNPNKPDTDGKTPIS